ncbi:MAG: FHA domain-containing protein [Kaiparowitsia implicata GSE-PSE-MK54-09C]|nr:FHA domain-containing protein [Kaiparowitsia implicata GSE-PSE-MK54-09C]
MPQDVELQQRLGLYQAFLKLYEHNRELLDEILSLETTASKALANVSLPYIQGMLLGNSVYLTTNLLDGCSQVLTQPQHIWTIGRDRCQASIAVADQRLSRRHAAIRFQSDGFDLIDLDSSNGSFVNGERVRRMTRLKDGDRIRLGSLTVTFFVGDRLQRLCNIPPHILAELTEEDVRVTRASVSPVLDSSSKDEPITIMMPSGIFDTVLEADPATATTVDPDASYPPNETLSFLRNSD